MDAKLHKILNSAMEQENCIKIRKSITKKKNYKHTYHVSKCIPTYSFVLKCVMQADES